MKKSGKMMAISTVFLLLMLIFVQSAAADTVSTRGKIQWIHWKTGTGDPYIDAFRVNDVVIHAGRSWTPILQRLFNDQDSAEFEYESYAFGFRLVGIGEFASIHIASYQQISGQIKLMELQ